MAGRPRGSKRITEELTKGICDLIEIGMVPHWAAQAKGIPYDTFQGWMQQGNNGDKHYVEFSTAIARARAQAMANMLVKSLEGGKGSGAAMWILERQYRAEYGPPKQEPEKQEHLVHFTGGNGPLPK